MTDSDHSNATAWGRGLTPDREGLIRFADSSFYAWPNLRWSFSHMEELVPTRSVWRGTVPVLPLEYDLCDLDDLAVRTLSGRDIGWAELHQETCADGLIVLQGGVVRYEAYFGACEAHTRHIVQSANKSIVGVLLESLIAEQMLDAAQRVTELIPELAGSAYERATVQQVLDMVVDMQFEEDYLDSDSEIWTFHRATGMAPIPAGHEVPLLAEVLPRVPAAGAHGQAFAYREPNIFVLGWILRRVAGKPISDLLSERIWQHLGAERDGYYLLDAAGGESSSCFTLRDFARFGELFRMRGCLGDQQLIPAEVVDKVFAGGNQQAFARAGYETLPNWSYRSQWWIRHLEDRICPVARGAHGQFLYIDPANELVVARFGSGRKAPSVIYDDLLLPMLDAITARLASG